MKVKGMWIRWSGLIFLTILMVAGGCGGGSSGQGGTPVSTINGRILGVSAVGATIQLLDQNGVILATQYKAVDETGAYLFRIYETLPRMDYYVLCLIKGQSALRAIITGFDGQENYQGQDAWISPETEAAFLLCGLTNDLRMDEYAAYLGAAETGSFDLNDPEAALFSYYEVIDDVTRLVAQAFDNGQSTDNLFNEITAFIEDQNHRLDENPPQKNQDGAELNLVFVSQDRTGLVFADYDPKNSTIDPDTRVSVVSSDQADGSFTWKEYDLDLGANVLVDLDLETAELNSVTRASNAFSRDPVVRDQWVRAKARIAARDRAGRLTQNMSQYQDATGLLTLAASNVADLLDIDLSGLAPQNNNTSAAFRVVFAQNVKAGNITISFILQDQKGNNQTLSTIVVIEGTTFVSGQINLVNANNQDKMIIADIKSGSGRKASLYSICDAIDLTRYQDTFPVIAAKNMAQTRAKPDSDDFYNNLPKTNDVGLQPQVTGNTYSHPLIDLDRLMGKGVSAAWDQTAYGQAPPYDSGRIPLILVHGWQGDKKTRSAARLSFFEYSPVRYFYKFICYYLTSPELNEKYHVYLFHWPSYKHLTYSADLFSQLLNQVKTDYPETDLGAGLNDTGIGVVFITHSTGGLITRSAIETHGAVSDDQSPTAFLRGAILLASPNHGTPLATNMAPNYWAKDVGTQSSSDLEWDSFDGQTKIKILGITINDYLSDRARSRWPTDIENVKEFDEFYLSLLGDPDPPTFNPWLLWFDRTFYQNNDDYKDYYILYSGWTRIWPNSADFIDSSFTLGVSDVLLKAMGLENDSVLPIGSNLMAKSASDHAFHFTSPTPPTIDDYPNSQMFFLNGLPILTIGSGQDHPLGMRFRLIMDYNHSQLVGGAFMTLSLDQVDQLMFEGDILGETVKTDWWHEYNRRPYIQSARTFKQGTDPGQITDFMNPLKQDPVFLIMAKDLLDLANR